MWPRHPVASFQMVAFREWKLTSLDRSCSTLTGLGSIASSIFRAVRERNTASSPASLNARCVAAPKPHVGTFESNDESKGFERAISVHFSTRCIFPVGSRSMGLRRFRAIRPRTVAFESPTERRIGSSVKSPTALPSICTTDHEQAGAIDAQATSQGMTESER